MFFFDEDEVFDAVFSTLEDVSDHQSVISVFSVMTDQ